MAKITIEEDGATRTFEGAISEFHLQPDIWTASTFSSGPQRGRTGTGSLTISINYTNGPQDPVDTNEKRGT